MRISEVLKTKGIVLHSQGLSVAAISDRLGVHPDTVRCWVDPEFAAKERARVRENSRRYRERQRAQRLAEAAE